MRRVIVRYFSTKIFLITDLYKMFELVFEYFGECQISLEEMTKDEQIDASEMARGIQLVKKNFYVYEVINQERIRIPELEKRIIDEGQR